MPQGSLVAGARDGLQDSDPRSGLLSLHARVEGVDSEAWEAPDLAQVFGPRGAIYLVPRADIPVFTLGLLPRDEGRRAAIEADADRLCALWDSGHALPYDRSTRWAGATGRLLPRWDASHTIISARPAPDADPEDCRRELARRFLHVAGPATAAQLQWFTDGSRADAEATLAAIAGELTEVEVNGQARWLLSADAGLLAAAPPASGLRLLPPGDPYLARADKELLVADAGRRAEVWPRAPAPGVLVVGGEIAGTWRRRGPKITMWPWRAVPRDRVEEEAATMPLPGSPHVVWTS